jgi:hypothetical protein
MLLLEDFGVKRGLKHLYDVDEVTENLTNKIKHKIPQYL